MGVPPRSDLGTLSSQLPERFGLLSAENAIALRLRQIAHTGIARLMKLLRRVSIPPDTFRKIGLFEELERRDE